MEWHEVDQGGKQPDFNLKSHRENNWRKHITKYSSLDSNPHPLFFPAPHRPPNLLQTVITVVRFPHRTRDIGSVPLDGHGGVGWEPELTPHNNCLAVAVPPVTHSSSQSGEMERNGPSEEWEWRWEKPRRVPYAVNHGDAHTHTGTHFST